LARFNLNDLPEPVYSGIVDSLSDIEAKVKATVIAASKDDHKLVLFMLCLGNSELRILLFEIVGIDESCLVPQELLAGAEMFRKQSLNFLLNNVLIHMIDSIPKFGFSFMDEVDA
jgi:hypothetical protein